MTVFDVFVSRTRAVEQGFGNLCEVVDHLNVEVSGFHFLVFELFERLDDVIFSLVSHVVEFFGLRGGFLEKSAVFCKECHKHVVVDARNLFHCRANFLCARVERIAFGVARLD